MSKNTATKPTRFTLKPIQFLKIWTLEELNKSFALSLEGNLNFTNVRNMFEAATSFACHRFNGEGGGGDPDLSIVAGKFSPRDLLESIIEPSKSTSDQYGSTVFTMQDGSTVTGRIASSKEATMMVCTNRMASNNFTNVDRRKVVKMEESKVSMMAPRPAQHAQRRRHPRPHGLPPQQGKPRRSDVQEVVSFDSVIQC